MPNETFTLINGTLGYSTNGVFDGVSIFGTDYEHCMCFKEAGSGQIYFYPKILRTHLSDSTTPTRADFNRIYSEGTEFCCIRKELVEEPIDLPPLPLTYGTNNIVPNTNIQPSNVEAEYYIEHEKQDKWECIADIVADGNTNSFELTDLNLKSVKMYSLCPKTDARHSVNLSLRFSNLGDTLYTKSPGDFIHSSYTIDNIIDIKTKPFLDMICSHGLYTSAGNARGMYRILTQDKIPCDTNVGGITYKKNGARSENAKKQTAKRICFPACLYVRTVEAISIFISIKATKKLHTLIAQGITEVKERFVNPLIISVQIFLNRLYLEKSED